MHELVAQLLREPVESIDIDEDLLNRGLDSVRNYEFSKKWRREGKNHFCRFSRTSNCYRLVQFTIFTNSTGAVTNRLHNKGVVKNA